MSLRSGSQSEGDAHRLEASATGGSRRRVVLALLMLGAMLAVAGRVWQWSNDPRFCLLSHESDARWIRANRPFVLPVNPNPAPTETRFLYEFSLTQPVPGSVVRVRALRQFRLWLDSANSRSAPLCDHTPADGPSWQVPREIRLPPLSAGRHRLLIAVTSHDGPPCLLVSSPDLGLFTGRHWQATGSASGWSDAADVDDPPVSMQPEVAAAGYPTSAASFRRVWPWLLIVFGLTFGWTCWRSRSSGSSLRWIPDRFSPSAVRWILLGAWWLLATNNIWTVTTRIGIDSWGHLEYVRYLIEHLRVPLASDGWQLFQSPLQYVLAAPVYGVASSFLSPDECAKLLRVFPLLCGMAQIEIIFRSARLVFPKDDDRQVVAMVVGGMMPMSLYMPQTFCNEPLAACLTSVVVLQCLALLSRADRTATGSHRSVRESENGPGGAPVRVLSEAEGIWWWSRLGCVWGLALLAKVTPVLLAPLVVLTIVHHGMSRRAGIRWQFTALTATLGSCLIVCGWYYARNWVYLGRPFVGGADPSRGIVWIQDPGYRTWHQMTSFGSSMIQPVYAVALSFWDGMYASMWADGQLSGTLLPARQIPWNVDFLQVGPWTAVVPMACLLLGLVVGWGHRLAESRVQILFAVLAVGIYLAAILDQYVGIPFFSTAKSSYALGLLPCFGVIAAVGAGAFLWSRLLRALLFGALSSWAFASYCAFFCLK